MTEILPLINKNIIIQGTHKFLVTSMVSHRGTPVSFAMRDDSKIFYSTLDKSNKNQNPKPEDIDIDIDNDKNYWSKVKFKGTDISNVEDERSLGFPNEITQVGYGVVPNFQIDKYDSSNKKVIHSYDTDNNPLDNNNSKLSDKDIKDKTDSFHSSTARLGAKTPFQVLSDGRYIYLFRQSIAGNNESSAIVNNTLLIDRFILSGSVLKLSREIRYRHSRHKTEPQSRKDTLSAVDVEGKPFYEPTRELVFANNLENGNFSVLLIPGADSEEQRWQIFTTDSVSKKVNSFNIRFDYDIVFDTSDSQVVIDKFIKKNNLDNSFIFDIQGRISADEDDQTITTNDLSTRGTFNYTTLDNNAKKVLEDELNEVVYTLRTGVSKDDFILESTSEWPLIEYDTDGSIKSNYLENGILKNEYTFQGTSGELRPQISAYTPVHGLSSCYYHQQETGSDSKPMKNKACVMLAIKVEDSVNNEYIGILNFSVAASGKLSRLTTDAVNMPDINVQALDQNPYRDLTALNAAVAWQNPQPMILLDIDPNGLSTSGGVLKFAYTSAAIGTAQGYSDAVVTKDPYLFDDSLGRVNLYFRGGADNFFVLYFNPTGNKSITVTDSGLQKVSPPLSLKPRLDLDMSIDVVATVPTNSNTCTLTMTSSGEVVEKWDHLPKDLSQITGILNGNGELPLGTLEPLGLSSDLRAAYTSGGSIIKIRTKAANNLLFKNQTGHNDQLEDGKTHISPSLSNLSNYLATNTSIRIAKKSFRLTGDVSLNADIFYKSYLSDMVNNDTADVDRLWLYLTTTNLIGTITGKTDRGTLKSKSMIGTATSLGADLTDAAINGLSLNLLQEGNSRDKNNRRAKLKQSLITLIMDVAKVRIVTFNVQDTNSQSVDKLEAGLAVSIVYDYTSHFACSPDKLSVTSASNWEHNRSYLFNTEVATNNTSTEISSSFNYLYAIQNTIGQWEDWEASLALELNPTSSTNGAALELNTTNATGSSKLEALQPTENGLSVEAWVKPSVDLNMPGSILDYKKGEQRYSLGIKKDTDTSTTYKCVATLGNKKYTSKSTFPFKNSAGNEQWRHLAFTHKKYWGYKLESADKINCGNDSSLQLKGEFSLEVLVKVKAKGTLLEKEGEYSLSINNNREVVFNWGGKNFLEEWVSLVEVITSDQQSDTENYKLDNETWKLKRLPSKLNLNEFYKLTFIRSKNKPATKAIEAEYPITGGGSGSGNKWYKDKDSAGIIKGMAEKQDQMDKKMTSSQAGLLGSAGKHGANPTYYHTLIITDNATNSKQWTSFTSQQVDSVEAFSNFTMGSNNFAGTFAGVRIWNRALSINEAKALALPENKAGLLSHWRMVEGKGTYLYDAVSENHGVANGGNWIDSPQSNQAGQFQFYVDGSPEAHDDSSSPSSTAQDDQFSIGGVKKTGAFDEHFKGTLEEIRIWNLPRTNEQITDNVFGRLKGEWEQLLANYTFDSPIDPTNNQVKDSGVNSIQLTIHNQAMLKEVLSTAPIATEIPQVRSALTGVLTAYNGTIKSRPAVVEYGDVQTNDDGTFNGILKRCYSFIDKAGYWNRMTGYKVGNLVSQWHGQAQFAPQVMGYLEGPAPVPAENFAIGKDADVDTYAYLLDNSVNFIQAEEFSYNYSTSKEAGWNVAVDSEMEAGTGTSILVTVSDIKSQVSHQNRSQLTLKEPWGAYFKKIVF